MIEERQRCDALVNDNDSMLRLLEETRAQKLQIENNFKEKIEQLNLQINNLQDQLENEV